MQKITVVRRIAIPVLNSIKPSPNPARTMRQRGFGFAELSQALHIIGSQLADSNQTADGGAYAFHFTQKFVTDGLDASQPELVSEIDSKTKPIP